MPTQIKKEHTAVSKPGSNKRTLIVGPSFSGKTEFVMKKLKNKRWNRKMIVLPPMKLLTFKNIKQILS